MLRMCAPRAGKGNIPDALVPVYHEDYTYAVIAHIPRDDAPRYASLSCIDRPGIIPRDQGGALCRPSPWSGKGTRVP